MDNQSLPTPPKTLARHILGYAMGQGVVSLTMNGISAYFMLYYTQALGMAFAQAGMAFAVAGFWDAIVDPAIGHISDNTHTRWGRRQPYILCGGLLMAISFYFIWAVPGFVLRGGHLFAYVLFISLFFRTAYAIFTVPYGALGFEVCTDYNQRAQLQGIALAVSMLTDFLGPGLGWLLFFPDRQSSVGPEATSVVSNYLHMGAIFSVATVGLTGAVVLATRRYMRDTRGLITGTGNSLKAFYRDTREIIADRYLRPIVIFFCAGLTGTVFVAMLQIYLYVYFMHLTSLQKTIIHGGGVVLLGLSAIAGAPLARRFDKKFTVCVGAAITSGADLLAAILFAGGILKPTTVCHVGGHVWPIAVIVFGACNMFNWLGVGIFWSLAMSMVADVAEVNELSSGVRKDGGYSAVFSFIYKSVHSAAIFIASACLTWVGFVKGSDQQSPEAVHWLVLLTFGLGSLFTVAIIPVALRYPITQDFMAKVKEALAQKATESASRTA